MKRVFSRLLGDVRARLAVLTALLAVCVFRVGFYVPSPGIDHEKLARHLAVSNRGAADQADELFKTFINGELGQSSEDAAR